MRLAAARLAWVGAGRTGDVGGGGRLAGGVDATVGLPDEARGRGTPGLQAPAASWAAARERGGGERHPPCDQPASEGTGVDVARGERGGCVGAACGGGNGALGGDDGVGAGGDGSG